MGSDIAGAAGYGLLGKTGFNASFDADFYTDSFDIA